MPRGVYPRKKSKRQHLPMLQNGRPPILNRRQVTHGSFADNAEISQVLKCSARAVVGNARYLEAHPVHREAFEQICLKFSRIFSGQGMRKEHWEDIVGYAQLGLDICTD